MYCGALDLQSHVITLTILFNFTQFQGGEVCPDCISETVRCRKLILGRNIG